MKEFDKQRPVQEAVSDGVIEGRNAVIEALRAGTAIDKIYLAKGETDKTARSHRLARTGRGRRGRRVRPPQA